MQVIPGTTLVSTFGVTVSGSLANADALPSMVVYRNGVLTSLTVAVTQISQGIYGYSVAIPANWVLRDRVSGLISYTYNTTPKNRLFHIGDVEPAAPGIMPNSTLNSMFSTVVADGFVAPDEMPTMQLYRGSTLEAVAVGITQLATGLYQASTPIGGWDDGDRLTGRVDYRVGGIDKHGLFPLGVVSSTENTVIPSVCTGIQVIGDTPDIIVIADLPSYELVTTTETEEIIVISASEGSATIEDTNTTDVKADNC